MSGALVNGSFEGGVTRETHTGQLVNEIFTPEGWISFWREGGPVPHDLENKLGYCRPEQHVIERVAPYLNPPRILVGSKAVKLFTFYRIHDAGIYQSVPVKVGDRLSFTASAHAWSSNSDDPYKSDTEGGAVWNVSFTVGIDPRGGRDPWADSVIWGEGANIYNVYGDIPAVEAVAQADRVTVFIRSTVLWPFKHCDAYIDNARLTVVTAPEPPTPTPTERGKPRAQYRRHYHLLPQNVTRAQAHAILDRIFDSKGTLGFSADDAGIGDLDERFVTVYHPELWTGDLRSFFATWYADAQVTFDGQPQPPQPEKRKLYLGFNDHPAANGLTAAKWLMGLGGRRLVVRPIFLGTTPTYLNFSAEAAAGVRTIVNLRYGWDKKDNGGLGTLPIPGTAAWDSFVEAAAVTIANATGVWAWEFANEYNNPREWPAEGHLTADQVAVTYNAVRRRVQKLTGTTPRMSPGAVDPYNAEAGDPRNWVNYIYRNIDGAEFIAVHGYVRGPDPSLVGSQEKFASHPLTYQYLNFPGCCTTMIEALPSAVKALNLPVVVTEFNHIWRTVEGDWGWVSDQRAADVIKRAVAAAEQLGFEGLALFRWAGDPQWETWQNTVVLAQVIASLAAQS